MRKDRIRQLAEVIEKCEDNYNRPVDDEKDSSFTMRLVWYDCGTPACISGWTRTLFGDGIHGSDIDSELLGISSATGQRLFLPFEGGVYWAEPPDSPRYITAKHAAAVLRNLADTGELDWTVGRA